MRWRAFLYLLTVTSFCLAEYRIPPAPPEVQQFDSGPAERQPCSWYDLSFPKSLDAEINARAGFKTCLQGFQAGGCRMVVFYKRLSTITTQAA